MNQQLYTKEEVVRRGKELYELKIRPQVEEGNIGKILVLDIETGDYAIDEDHLTADRLVRERHPDGVFYGMRIGFPSLGKIGGSWESLKK
jgi:hypothetical protein